MILAFLQLVRVCSGRTSDWNRLPEEHFFFFFITIAADARLMEPLSDFLIGVMGAAVEMVVDDAGSVTAMHGFIEQDAGDERSRVRALEQITQYAAELAGLFGVPVPQVDSEPVADQDWATSWQAYFKPFSIIPGLVIVPSWESYQRRGDEQVIVMDPGMAFGTGHHATTRLCLQLLEAAVRKTVDSPVLDVGTGTGILAMAAALFGAGSVIGVDNDEVAVGVATTNVRNNALADRVDVASTPLTELSGPFRVIVANIVHDTLAELADELTRLAAPGGEIILSGLICGEQVRSMVQRFASLSCCLEEQVQEGEWCALRLKKQGVGRDGS
ncbi:MAG: 50S ribosomal protein L11 methyltransferase [Desulfofustis sp.]|jgi:ribosomal protein L11 methyltransferase|nr:50S ribosomal protein L11 methyltransferase [Desulfofustis sp.]